MNSEERYHREIWLCTKLTKDFKRFIKANMQEIIGQTFVVSLHVRYAH